MTAIDKKSTREVASFDEGELWADPDARPPSSPAGWYFRAGRGSPALWVGPFDAAADAWQAPASGDPLRDARKYLDRWQRGDCPAPLRLVAARRPAAAPPPMTADGQFELSVGASAPPAAKPPRRAPRRAAGVQQYPLPLDL